MFYVSPHIRNSSVGMNILLWALFICLADERVKARKKKNSNLFVEQMSRLEVVPPETVPITYSSSLFYWETERIEWNTEEEHQKHGEKTEKKSKLVTH